ncbi:MAG: hypothetical protein IT317_17035 [Anaerolineales bacterium]|nr:hypothetical protein [Anaerolineales bacterium]
MARPEIDWTFATAPEPQEPPAPAPPRRGPGRFRWPRGRWLAGLGLLLALAAGGAWVVVRVGEQRVRAQLTAEVVYEDEQSLAGAADLALSVWGEPPFTSPVNDPLVLWRKRRAAEVALGLAAPLPVAALTPAGGPPSVTAVKPDPNNPNFWIVTVVRGYHDSAGGLMQFALDQRYQSAGPGLWQRVPPNTAAPAATTIFAGERISITLPVDALPDLSDSLFALDAALVQACADWGTTACGDDQLVAVFTAQPNLLPAASAIPPGAEAGRGPYPWAFDLAAAVPPAPTRLYLPSPQVAGRPHDDAARAALTHALTVYGLTALANAQTGKGELRSDFFRDALVARAELRLGLTAPPTYTLQAADYLSVAGLWAAGPDTLALEPSAALPLSLQALQFLDLALGERPPTADAALLRALTRRPDLRAWLTGALGQTDTAAALAAWEQQAAAQLNAAGAPPAASLDGLLYTCAGETFLQRGGAALALPDPAPWPGQSLSNMALSAAGRYLARVTSSEPGVARLEVLDLAEPQPAVPVAVADAPEIYLIGWANDQTLVYAQRLAGSSDSAILELRGYDRAAGQSRELASEALAPWFLGLGDWLPDRTGLVVNLALTDTTSPLGFAPALISLEPGVPPRQLVEQGFPARLSPDGRLLVYGLLEPMGVDNFQLLTLMLLDRATGAQRLLARAADLNLPDGPAVALFNLLPLAWTGDSAWVVALAAGNTSTHLYLLPASPGGPPIALPPIGGEAAFFMAVAASPDGRYLSYWPYGQAGVAPLTLLDLASLQPGATTAAVQTLAQQAAAAAWAPTGHRLAVAGRGGLRLIDLDTGATRWLDFRDCGIVEWYAPPLR